MTDLSGLLFKEKEAIKIALIKPVLGDTIFLPFRFRVDPGHFRADLACVCKDLAIQ